MNREDIEIIYDELKFGAYFLLLICVFSFAALLLAVGGLLYHLPQDVLNRLDLIAFLSLFSAGLSFTIAMSHFKSADKVKNLEKVLKDVKDADGE